MEGLSVQNGRLTSGAEALVKRTLSARLKSCPDGSTSAALAALSGLLLVFSFPKFDLYPLSAVALAPLILVAAREVKAGVTRGQATVGALSPPNGLTRSTPPPPPRLDVESLDTPRRDREVETALTVAPPPPPLAPTAPRSPPPPPRRLRRQPTRDAEKQAGRQHRGTQEGGAG